jgi:protein-S-isoprenylcysteine O-methyltransferase Ste14
MLQRLRVPLGFVFAALFIFFAEPTWASLGIGSTIAFIGLAIRAWASGHIRKVERLAVTGPYSFTRNPLYLGSLLMGAGFSVAGGVWWLGLAFAVMFLGIYWPVMRAEEEDLTNIFGDDFREYRANVPLLIPRLTAWRKSDARFDFQLYLRYREYRAAIGVGLGIAALLAIVLFRPI